LCYHTKGLHSVLWGLATEQLAVKAIPRESDVNAASRRLLLSDGAVAFILLQGGHTHNTSGNPGLSVARENLFQLVKHLAKSSGRDSHDSRRAKRTVDKIELASYGIALLLTERKNHPGKELKHLERNIQTLVPGILLYCSDESEESKGCSVEAQLEDFGWTGIEDNELSQYIVQHWKSGAREIAAAYVRQILPLAITGLSVALLFGIFGSYN
jgi:hypothetical protein